MTKLTVILENDPVIFQDKFNAKMEELKWCDPEYEFIHTNGFCVYITYSDSKKSLNDPSENEYYLRPNTCALCSYSDPPLSNRVRWCHCRILNAAVNLDSSPCEQYLEVENGN